MTSPADRAALRPDRTVPDAEVANDDEAVPAQRLRIAFLSYRSDPRVGGQGIFLTNVARALAQRGHAVTIISGPPYPEVPDGVEMVQLPSLDLFAQPLLGRYALRWRHLKSWTDTAEYFGHVSGKFMEPWSFGRRAARWLAQHGDRFDVVLDNQTLTWGLLEIARSKPTVAAFHHPIRRDLEIALANEPEWGKRWLLRRWYSFLPMQEAVARALPSLATVSSASADDIVACMGADRSRINVVPLAVDQAMFRPGRVPREARRIVTTSSSDMPLKGLKYLIRAHTGLLKDWPDLELVIVGRPRPGPTVDLMEQLGTRNAVNFVHDLSTDAMADLYASATLCVTPSLYEGFGLPMIEAMASGAPVVATDGGALPEVVGDAGVIVPAGDAETLRGAIDELLRDPVRREGLSAAGLKRVRAHYHWDSVGATYERLLYEAVARGC